jgi:hypothetical protein
MDCDRWLACPQVSLFNNVRGQLLFRTINDLAAGLLYHIVMEPKLLVLRSFFAAASSRMRSICFKTTTDAHPIQNSRTFLA